MTPDTQVPSALPLPQTMYPCRHMPKKKTSKTPRAPAVDRAAICSADELAKRIAEEILTVAGVKCNRAAMMKGRWLKDERDMGGRNAASIAFVIREHLLAAGYPP